MEAPRNDMSPNEKRIRRQKEIRRHLIIIAAIAAAALIALILIISAVSSAGKTKNTGPAERSTAAASSSGAVSDTSNDCPPALTDTAEDMVSPAPADTAEDVIPTAPADTAEDVSSASSSAEAGPETSSAAGTENSSSASSDTGTETGSSASSDTGTESEPAESSGPESTQDGAGSGQYMTPAGEILTPVPTAPDKMPFAVLEIAAALPECYSGELLPAATGSFTDRSAEFSLQSGVPCGSDSGSGEKVVYLTLDDGPSANTITALNILDHYGIKATFFVTGHNPEYRYLIKEAYDRGHTIGLHTYSHDYGEIYSSAEAYYADLNAIGQTVAEQIGFVPCFIRFPGGSSNYISHDYTEGIMTFLTADVQNYGYQYFDWNASSGDGAETDNPILLADAAVKYDIYDTVVLLSHDSSTKAPTMLALPYIIEYYLSKGYEFRPITRDSYTAHHPVQN